LRAIAEAIELMNGFERFSGETASISRNFPVRENNFPVPDHREIDVMSLEMLGNLGPNSLRRSEIEKVPCIFPA
jgi:hypothetical protein